MIGKIAGMTLQRGLNIETILDPAVQPFLHDHQIDGTPVLPGVMGLEAFAEAALCLLPSWHVAAIENVNFLAPFKFYRSEPRMVTVEVTIHPQRDTLLAECRLIGRRSLPNQAEPQVMTHFTAQVRLTKKMPAGMTVPTLASPNGHIDRSRRHLSPLLPRTRIPSSGASVVGWRSDVLARWLRDLPSNHHPSEQPTLMAPRLIELCFQTAGLWEMGVQGRMGLPQHIRQVCLLGTPNLADGRFVCRGHSQAGSRKFRRGGCGRGRKPIPATEWLPHGGAP